eukprot:SAG22_NODE_116_length_19306_cov_247.696517_20_plen_134_part_00
MQGERDERREREREKGAREREREKGERARRAREMKGERAREDQQTNGIVQMHIKLTNLHPCPHELQRVRDEHAAAGGGAAAGEHGQHAGLVAGRAVVPLDRLPQREVHAHVDPCVRGEEPQRKAGSEPLRIWQ